MKRATTTQVAHRITAFYDSRPTRERVRTGGPMSSYYAGNRPGEAGPVVPSTRGMTADQDRALTLLSAGHPVTIAHINAGMGAYSLLMIRAMRDLTARGLAVFEQGAYRLAAVA
jgi:hypothetical protein